MRNRKLLELPIQVVRINRAVEAMAKMKFQDINEVELVIKQIRWDLSKVNFELCNLLLNEDE